MSGGLTAAALRLMAEKGLSALDIAEIAEANEASAAPSSAAARQKRYRDRKRNERDVTGDVTLPPKEEISNPPASEPIGSADEPPQDPVKQLFDLGVTILTDAGIGKERARSFVGKLKQEHGAAAVLQALLDCRAKNIAAPIDWLTKRFRVAKYVSASGYEYRGDVRSVVREAEKRADWATYWAAKKDSERAA